MSKWEGWLLALVLKPIFGIMLLALMWYGSHAVAWVIDKITPDCRLKRYLFLGWNSDRPATNGTGLVKD